jgi:hypothetical protein
VLVVLIKQATMNYLITSLQTLNQLLTAGIAITAFSLLLYALSFNLRDRVARSFASILVCVVIVFVGEALASVVASPESMALWLRLQWIGIVFLPPTYLHFSDALLATTGRPSRGRRRMLVRLTYGISGVFLLTMIPSWLVGSLVAEGFPAAHLERTGLTWVFAVYYAAGMIWAWFNFWRAYQRTVTSTSRRRMRYLVTGALAPALGSYPYLLFGSSIAASYPWIFWLAAAVSNILVSIFIVVMAYSVAFFGVPWPDRVVKRRLFKWVMRGPVTASTVLAITTLVRRAGESLGTIYSSAVPVAMVSTLLLMQYLITMLAPIWERWLFDGGDRSNLQLLQALEERLLTRGDLRQFLESLLTAVCDRLQVSSAFVVALEPPGQELLVTTGDENTLQQDDLSEQLLQLVAQNGGTEDGTGTSLNLFSWGDYWLLPLYGETNGGDSLLGLFGVVSNPEETLDEEQKEALAALVQRAAMALEDRAKQQQVFNSLEELTPQVDLIQRLRAAARYDGTEILTDPDSIPGIETSSLNKWVKDALSHYWGGPKLTESPLLRLQVVQGALEEHDGVSVNALRAILRESIDRVRPEGERRFTAEWILYNILEMKFMEGHKVREIAMRLAMSEADLYRKQRVAIEAVANALMELEYRAREEAEIIGENNKIKAGVEITS